MHEPVLWWHCGATNWDLTWKCDEGCHNLVANVYCPMLTVTCISGYPLKLHVLKQVPLWSVMVKISWGLSINSSHSLTYHFKSHSFISFSIGKPSAFCWTEKEVTSQDDHSSSVLKLHSSIGQGQAVNSLYTALLSLECMALYDTGLCRGRLCGCNTFTSLSLHFRRVWSGVQGSLAMASGCYNWSGCCKNTPWYAFLKNI